MALSVDATTLWYREGGTWYSTESYVEVYTAEGDTMSVWSLVGGGMGARRAATLRVLRDVALFPVKLMTPQPLEAQHFWSCRTQWRNYILATLAVEAATAAALEDRTGVAVRLALGSLLIWREALNNLIDCFDEQEHS